MSFLKITDPKKRDFMVEQFLKTKKNIQRSNVAKRLGDIDTQRDLTKFFKPVLESQKNIVEELKPIQEGIKGIKAITFPQFPSIEAFKEREEDEETTFIGPIAEQYMRKFASKTDVDKTFGLYDKGGKFYIGDKRVVVDDDNIKVDNKEYQGTPGLWELLISKKPDEEIYTDEDYDSYAKIMISTNALRKNNDPKELKPKASKGWKWRTLMKPIWKNKGNYEGSGTVIIPSDPNALVDRLDFLMASKKAGNTGVRNELVSICDELKRQNAIDPEWYKNFMLQL